MFRFQKNRSLKTGFPPGTVVHIGESPSCDAVITVTIYDADKMDVHATKSVEDIPPQTSEPSVTWIRVIGVHDTPLIEQLGERFEIDSLILEDIVNTAQRPKIERTAVGEFIILKHFWYEQEGIEISAEQFSLLLSGRIIITFEEREIPEFDWIIKRLRTGTGRLRSSGPEYLAYALMDILVDHSFGLFEVIGGIIEELESELIEAPRRETLNDLYLVRRELAFLYRWLLPMDEVIGKLKRSDTMYGESVIPFVDDLCDHVQQVVETLDLYREISNAMIDSFRAEISRRANETMKTLTMVAAIFLPLVFAVGFFGMNFRYFPGIAWQNGVFIITVVLMLFIFGALAFFKWRKWF